MGYLITQIEQIGLNFRLKVRNRLKVIFKTKSEVLKSERIYRQASTILTDLLSNIDLKILQ